MQTSLDLFQIDASTRAFFKKKKHQMLIGGRWVDSLQKKTFETYDPAFGVVHGKIPEGKKEDADLAVEAARKGFESPAWQETTSKQRQDLMLKLADIVEKNSVELAQIESLDNGKPLQEALEIDIPDVVALMRYMAGWATKIDGRAFPIPSSVGDFGYTLKVPVGVVAAIIPWNFPLVLAAWKFVPALVAGCSIVVKPSELTSLSMLRFGEMVMEAGYPEGIFNVLTGFGTEAGAALVRHPLVDKIAFTGSTNVGREISQQAAKNLTRVSLELGGKSPMLIFEDCDLTKTAQGIVDAFTFNQGQVCSAGSRVYIQRKIFDKFLSEVTTYLEAMQISPGFKEGCQLGPLISEEHRDKVTSYIKEGKAEGAKVYYGGNKISGPGYFVQPTIFTETKQTMKIVQKEIFGPVLIAAPYNGEAEAIELANDTKFGLAASIWTQDVSRIQRLISKIRAGTIWINTHNLVDPHLPFGGFKSSGSGRELGPEQLDSYLDTKSVWISS